MSVQVLASITPEALARRLAELEAVIRPIIYEAGWKEYMGHLTLRRETIEDREEQKRNERQTKEDERRLDIELSVAPEYSDPAKNIIWVKYTLTKPNREVKK